MKLDVPLPQSDNKEPNHEKRPTWAPRAQRQGLDGVFASDKSPTSSTWTLLPAQLDPISRPRSVLDEESIPPAPPPHTQRLPPDNQSLDRDGSDSDAGTLWQEPMIGEDIMAAKRPKSASRGLPSDQDGSDSEAGTLWQEPMIEEGILAAKRPKSASHGPPLTVKIDEQFGRQFGGPPGQASQRKSSSSSGRTTLISNSFPPPPQHPLPSPLPQWGGRTPTTRQLIMEQSKSEGTFHDSSWASRPSPEEVLDRLRDFFPDHDLDKRMSGMPSIPDSPSATGPKAPASKRSFLSWLLLALLFIPRLCSHLQMGSG